MRRIVWLVSCFYFLFCNQWGYSAIEKTAKHPQSQQYYDIDFISYVNTSYNYLVRSNRFTSGIYNRLYDIEENGFTLQQLYLSLLSAPTQGWGGTITAIIGRDANELAPIGFDPNVFDISTIGLTIPEANIQYTFRNFTFKVGEILSIAGIESFDYLTDSNFSRSILNGYAQAGTHVGVRGVQKLTQEWGLMLGINNGWNTIENIGNQKTLEGGMTYDLHSKLLITLDGYYGPQYLTDSLQSGPIGRRSLIDFYATWLATEQLNLLVNYDYGLQTKSLLPNGEVGRAIWQGIAGYINYQWTDKWKTSFRGEIFEDTNGYRTGIRQNWREITFTLNYTIIKNLNLYFETRHDFSNVGAFLNRNGINTNNNQQSYALDLMYRFT